jgi:hypothetical protein
VPRNLITGTDLTSNFMKHKILSFLLVFGLHSGILYSDNLNYSRTSEYDRMFLTTKDLNKIIEAILFYHQEAPHDSLDPYNTVNTRLTLTNKSRSVSLSSVEQLIDLDIQDEKFTEVDFYYSWKNKPISEVTLFLNPHYRKLTVNGTVQRKVDALFQDIDLQLKAKEAFLGHIRWDFFLAFIAFITFIIAFWSGFLSLKTALSPNRTPQSVVVLLFTLTYCTLAIIFFLSKMSFFDLLPGFEIAMTKSSWIDRNANLLGFICFVITMFSFIVSFTKWLARQSSVAKTYSNEEVTSVEKKDN